MLLSAENLVSDPDSLPSVPENVTITVARGGSGGDTGLLWENDLECLWEFLGFGPIPSKGQFQSPDQVLAQTTSPASSGGPGQPGTGRVKAGVAASFFLALPGFYLGGFFFLSALGCGYPEVFVP